ALQQVLSQSFEGGGFSAEGLEGGEGAGGELRGDLAGFFQTDNCRIGSFFCFGIFAGGLAELLAGLGDVENVIDDLEGKTDIVAETAERLELGGRAVGAHAAKADRATEQS